MDTKLWAARGYDSVITFDGQLLGEASSHRSGHSEHEPDFAPIGTRCSACRWFEVRIFRTDQDEYVVEITGQTLVEGERVRHRAEITTSAHWVVEMLTQREGDRRFIPLVSRRALAEAAARDLQIEHAYLNRVVA